MLTKLKVTFKNGDKNLISVNSSSLFHGYIMENINSDYGEYLHQNTIKPYSQHIYIENNRPVWEINTLNEEARTEIIDVILDKGDSIYIKNKNFNLITDKMTITKRISYNDILNQKCNNNKINIEIKTPMAFKHNGRYINIIDTDMFFNNIIRKFELFGRIELNKSELREAIQKNVTINEFFLKSTYFHLEGIKIPAVTGNFTLTMKNYRELNDIINTLVSFANFSGVGIKTAMGMGYIDLN